MISTCALVFQHAPLPTSPLKGVGFLRACLLAEPPNRVFLTPCERDARAPSTRNAGNAGVPPAIPTAREKTYPFKLPTSPVDGGGAATPSPPAGRVGVGAMFKSLRKGTYQPLNAPFIGYALKRVRTMQPTAEATTPKQTVSFEEFLEMLDDESHAEWVDGAVIPKMPVSVKHQDSNIDLIFLIAIWVKHHQLGKVYHPPLQVRLTLPDGRQVSREPDIVVVLNDKLPQLKKQYFDGAPNIVVEIVSPSRPIDYREKFIEYQSAGVPEYWIIDPEREYAEFWQLDDTGAYRVAYAGSEGVYRSRELPCFWLRVEWIWRQPPPIEIQREWGILPKGS